MKMWLVALLFEGEEFVQIFVNALTAKSALHKVDQVCGLDGFDTDVKEICPRYFLRVKPRLVTEHGLHYFPFD